MQNIIHVSIFLLAYMIWGSPVKPNASTMYVNTRVLYYDITNSLPKGYVRDGSEDYTAILQECINKYNNIKFPDFPILVNDLGLKLRSNSTLFFQSNSKLILKPSNKNGYNILDCNKKENIKILNATIVGDKSKHLGTKGEWGFGISIRGSKNIKVLNARISNCWGDGIYIGRFDNLISENIVISECVVTNSLRNGLSITSGKNIQVLNSVFSNSYGKGPSSGIDIEPNGSMDELIDIKLENIKTSRNQNWGLLINLVNLRKENREPKHVGILVNNLIDNSSKFGMSIWVSRKNNFKVNPTGLIQIRNVQLMSLEQPIKYYSNYLNGIDVLINNIKVSKRHRNDLLNVITKYKEDKRFKFNSILYQ